MSVLHRLTRMHWLLGVMMALAGVVLARSVGPALSQPSKAWVTVSGQVLAVTGLLVIAVGVRNRVRDADRG